MSNYEKRAAAPANWLAPTSGGVMLMFVGLLALVIADAAGVGIVCVLAGLVLGAYGLATRDRVKRYGR